MSFKNSNLYASRVFAEHPIAMWSLDEDYFFISLIPEEEKNITSPTWNIVNASSVPNPSDVPDSAPIPGAYTSKFFIPPSSSVSHISIYGNDINYSNLIDENKGSICFNIQVYAELDSNISSFDIGFISASVEYSNNILLPSEGNWEKISYTKNLTSTNNLKPFLRINYSDNFVPGEETSSFFINGLSVAQWSEPYNNSDTGTYSQTLPMYLSDILPSEIDLTCVPLDAYGFNDSDNAYAIQERKKLLVENSGIPMVYGSKSNVSILPKNSQLLFADTVDGGTSSTSIFDEIISGPSSPSAVAIDEISGGTYEYLAEEIFIPSIIFPSKGFLSSNGRYSSLTTEFWLRINNESPDPVKIFGPISNNDGIYVGADFLTVKVGKHVKSYFIGQWYRPMLINFGQSLNEIFLMINGEKIISIPVDLLSIATIQNNEDDFVGFFGSDLISVFDIDCFSIFPYIVSEQVAKKRYVYGQGVDEQENLVESINGDLHQVDFAFSGYNSTISYPDRTQWESGYFDNLNVSNNGLTLPKYQLPELIFSAINSASISNQSSTDFLKNSFEIDNFAIQDEDIPFISMSPNLNYSNYNGTLYFAKLNQLSYPAKSVYGVFRATSASVSSRQDILYFSNNRNNDYFRVSLQSGSIQYLFNETVLKRTAVDPGEKFAIGFSIDKVSESFSSTVSNFFSNTDSLSLNVGGSQGAKFYGKMFSFSINNSFATEKDELFNEEGFVEKTNTQDDSYIGSYTLLPTLSNETVFLDIAASGYWESSVPLSYFGKFTYDSRGNKVYDLDLVQFNIDTPSTSFKEPDQTCSNYENANSVKSYITVQHKDDAGLIPFTNYVTTELISQENKVLDIDHETNLDTTKFRVSNGTIIFPPKNLGSFSDYYVTTHLVLTSKGINTSQVNVKKMSFASLAFNESEFYAINSPTGKKFYPIVKNNSQYIYNQKNPVVIDIESAPYLYLTSDSGISVAPFGNDSLIRGISLPINQGSLSKYKATGVQLFLMFNRSRLIAEEQLIGRIISSEKSVDIVLVPELDGKRGYLKFLNSKSQVEISAYKLFLNGKLVDKIFIKPLMWNMITISFEDQDEYFNLDNAIGQLEIYSGVSINDFVAFKESSQVLAIRESYNEWINVLRDVDIFGAAEDPFDWQYWENLNSGSASWVDVLNFQRIPATRLGLNGKTIFNSYSGLASSIANDNSILSVNFDSIKFLSDVDWTNFEVKPI